eukprot:comp22008_c0_seq2/m.31864 comp22008_c0_seq2/g.31864  ORF comp22008_c0_seq2/g.31864 comp22008_c0_seq2/m.31864 type:complete len:453 (-) comp22008_c0_seq2:80-1438(-)
MWVTVVLAGGAAVALLVYATRRRPPAEGIPIVPGGEGRLGHMRTVLGHFQRGQIYKFHEQCFKQCGPFYAIRSLWGHNYGVCDATVIREVLNNMEAFGVPPTLKSTIEHVNKGSLLIMEGDPWRRQRKLLQPTFGAPQLRRVHTITLQEADLLLDTWAQAAGGRVLGLEGLKGLTMQVIGQLAFGLRFDEGTSHHSAVPAIFVGLSRRVALPFAFLWWFLPDRREFWGAVSTIRSVVSDILEKRAGQHSGGDTAAVPDAIDNMLGTRETEGVTGLKGLTDEEVLGAIFTLYLAGHETTSNGLFWCLYCLSQNMEAQVQLQKEVDEMLQGRPATYDEILQMRYLEGFIKETLRLFPPAMSTVRVVKHRTNLGPFVVGKDDYVVLNIFLAHRDPKYYTDPDRFDPARWLNEEEGKGAFFPFGHGPKNCIGWRVAMAEMRCFVARLMQVPTYHAP